MYTLLFVALLIAALAAIGRVVTPRRERLPVRTWSARDVWANAVHGARFLLTCSDHVEALLPQLRPPGRHGSV